MKKNDLRFKIENDILKGIELSDSYDYTSLGKFVLDTLETDEDFVGQVDLVTEEKYTYRKMRERSVRCALWMKSQGLVQGDVVTLCSHDHMDVAMPWFAALYVGAAVNLLDGAMNAKEILHVINITKPKLAFVSEKSARPIAEAAEEAKLDIKIIVFGHVAGFPEFESVITVPKAEDVKSFQCTPIENPRETAIIMCTSGTTGLPKVIPLSHETILGQLLRIEKIGMKGNNCLVFAALFWITGATCLFINLLSKVTRNITPPFEEHLACSLVDKYKINWMFLAPSMINRLLKSGALEKYDFSHVKCILFGGCPLALTSQKALAKFMPNALIVASCGLTEIGGLLAMQTINSKPGSCGQIVENAQLKIADLETGRSLGVNQRGEILLKMSSMMSSYCGNSQATAEVIDNEGWLHTGDLGYFDEDGELFIVDRLKELIKYRYVQVSPFDIETVILSHPGVEEVAVVGMPHFVDDEHPFAFVVRAANYSQNGREVTEIELTDLVASTLSDSNRLRGGVKFVDSLPKSSAGKVRRKQLREWAAEFAVRVQTAIKWHLQPVHGER